MSRKVNQSSEILRHLIEKGSITPDDAIHLYGCTRLAARIHDFRDRGHLITTIMVEGKTRYGDRCEFAKYIYKGKEEN